MVVQRSIMLEDVEAAVRDYFRIDPETLRTGRRQSQVYCRHVFAYVARYTARRFSTEEAASHLGQTGWAFGHGIKSIESRISVEQSVAADVAAIRAILAGETVEAPGRGHVVSERERLA